MVYHVVVGDKEVLATTDREEADAELDRQMKGKRNVKALDIRLWWNRA